VGNTEGSQVDVSHRWEPWVLRQMCLSDAESLFEVGNRVGCIAFEEINSCRRIVQANRLCRIG
jgi:hypothetical protein